MISGVDPGRRYNAAETFIDANRVARADRIAIRCQGRSVTYGELGANVDRAGNALKALGVQMEQRVVMQVLDTPAFPYAFFGAIKIGAIPVPTNMLLVPHDLRYILEDTRAVAIVVSAPLLPRVLEAAKELPRVKHILVTGAGVGAPDGRSPAQDGALSFEAALQAADDELDPADTTQDDPCFWLYSSGTTGFPKGAVHLQHDMRYACETFGANVLRTTEEDRYLTVSPLFHAYGLGNGVFTPFYAGASAVYKPERPTPDLVYGLITSERPTVLFSAPTFYAALLAYPEEWVPLRPLVVAVRVLRGRSPSEAAVRLLEEAVRDRDRRRDRLDRDDACVHLERTRQCPRRHERQDRAGLQGQDRRRCRHRGAGGPVRPPLGLGRLVLRVLLESA